MSEATIKRTYERYEAHIERACQEGRGQKLLHDYFQALAADFASTVFGLIGRTLETRSADFDGEEHVVAWMQSIIVEHGESVITSVRQTLQSFHASAEQIAEAETDTAIAYRDRIEQLFAAAASPGGMA